MMEWGKVHAALALIILLGSLGVLARIMGDRSPPTWDESWHLMLTEFYLRHFTGKADDIEAYPILAQMLERYPPAYHIVSAFIKEIFGFHYPMILSVNLFYLAALVFSVYKIGARAYSPRTGLLAALIVASYPTVQYHMRFFLIDFALAAVVSVGVWALLCSRELRSGRHTISFLIVFLAGLLTKGNFLVFIVGPLLIVVAGRIMDGAFTQGGVKGDAALAFCLMFLVFSAKMLLISYPVYASMDVAPSITQVIRPADFSVSSVFRQVKTLFNATSVLYAPLLLLGLAATLRDRTHEKLVVLAWFVVPAVVVGLQFAHNLPRHMLPALPALALVTAEGVARLSSKRVFYATAFASVFIVVSLSWGLPFQAKEVSGFYVPYSPAFILQAGGDSWPVKEVLDDISRLNDGKPFSLQVIADMPYFNDISFPYTAYENRMMVKRIIGPVGRPEDFDFVLVAAFDKPKTWRYQAFMMKEGEFQSKENAFSLAKTYELPGNSTARLYKNRAVLSQ